MKQLPSFMNMGLINSFLRLGNDLDTRNGLTSREKYLLKSTWEAVMKDPTENGIKLFLRFFEIQPEHQKLFPFRDVPIADLPQSKTFQAHCTAVIYSLASFVEGIENPDLIRKLAENIGHNHATRGLNEHAYMELKQAILDTFSFMSPKQLAAWSKFIDMLFDNMRQRAH